MLGMPLYVYIVMCIGIEPPPPLTIWALQVLNCVCKGAMKLVLNRNGTMIYLKCHKLEETTTHYL